MLEQSPPLMPLLSTYNMMRGCKPDDHTIIELKPDEYEEPYKSMHPFKCTICGKTFSPHWLEQVDGKWRVRDFAAGMKTKKRSARRR